MSRRDGQWSTVLDDDGGEEIRSTEDGLALEARKDMDKKEMLRHEWCYI